jgi:TolB-like protein/AraC-like DNA-binding protein
MPQTPSMDQAFLHKLTEIIEANLHDEKFGVMELSRAVGMSRSGIHRKIKAITKKPLNQLIREYRLYKAMEMLRNQEATASQIAYRVGFGSPAYFNKCFHDHFGYPPGEVKKTEIQDQNHPDNPFMRSLLSGKSNPEHIKNSWNILKKLNIRVVFFIILSAVILFGVIIISNTPLLKRSDHARSHRETNPDKSIAVLPFENLSDDPDNQYFADGMMENIINNLYRIREFRVISRTTSEHFRGSNLTSPEIAKELNVGFVLEGSVFKYENKARIFVQLIDARRDQHVWSEKYDRDLTDIFAVQANIARNIARELETVLSDKEIKQIDIIPTQNQEAYDNYLRGRYFWNKRTEDGIKKSIACFERSIALDPDFALAFAGLANSYLIGAWWGWYPKAQYFDKARNLALRTLEIDESLAEAHAILGCILKDDRKWEDARKEFILAVECNPRDATSRQFYAEFLIDVGEKEEARRQIDLARELDPLSVIIRLLSGYFYYYEGKTKEALDEAGVIQEIDSTFVQTYWLLERIYIQEKEGLKLLGLYERLTHIPGSLKSADGYKKAYAESGIDGVNEFILEINLKRQNPIDIALRYAMLKDKEKTLKWIEKACEMHITLGNIYIVPEFEFIRSDPRFWEIMKRIGLSQYYTNLTANKNLP